MFNSEWQRTTRILLGILLFSASPLAYSAAKAGTTVENVIGMKLVLLETSVFVMGSPEDESDRRSTETQRVIQITSPFYLGAHEVTQAQYEKVMGNNPSKTKDPRLPVDHISWHDAVAFCAALTALDPRFSYRLPTEAEWEYACRAGTRTRYYWGVDANLSQIGDHAFYKENAEGKTHPVGQKKPNAWGLYDMNGNVWEWCQDWMASYDPNELRDPKGPGTGDQKVCRGGCWAYDAARCRSAERNEAPPDSVHVNLGMRVVAVPKPSER